MEILSQRVWIAVDVKKKIINKKHLKTVLKFLRENSNMLAYYDKKITGLIAVSYAKPKDGGHLN